MVFTLKKQAYFCLNKKKMATANNINVGSFSSWNGEYSDLALMATDVLPSLPCWEFRIRGMNFCSTPEPSVTEIFFANFGNWQAPRPVKTEEVRENGYGQRITIRKVIRFEYGFEFICDDNTVRILTEIECANEIRGYFSNAAGFFELEDFKLELKQSKGAARLCEITFFQKDEVFGKTACCNPAYTDAPYIENCPPSAAFIIATDDIEAGSLGVAIGAYYELNQDTPYGTPHQLRIRKS